MLFTTLVPVYKTHFLDQLIACLNAQTERRFSVIFSDDSPGQDVAAELADLAQDCPIDFHYEVIPGPRHGPSSNCYHLYTAWNGRSPYIHYLLDDDIIAPTFYAQHLQALEQHGIQLCISARSIVNQHMQPVASPPARPAWLDTERPTPLEFGPSATSTIGARSNWLGELSCATFHADSLTQLKGGLLRLPYYGLNDLGIFLEIIHQHSALYLPQTLGAFRLNRHQTSGDSRSSVYQSTTIAWAALALDAHTLGVLDAQGLDIALDAAQTSVSNLLASNPQLQALHTALHAPRTDLAAFAAQFSLAWLHFVRQLPDFIHTHSPRVPGTLR